jgi:GNAT superfamily N-acetyltransferase
VLQSFRRANFPELANLWSNYFPPRYHVDSELLKLNTVDCPVFDWGASLIHAPDGPAQGFVVVKKAAAGKLYPGNRSDDAFLCAIAYKEPQTAVDLLAEVKAILRNRGVRTLHFGQDAWHFFPGVPTDFSALRNLLEVEGFVSGPEAHDMERDLDGYENKHPLPNGYFARPLSLEDLPTIKEFMIEEFPGRWPYDIEEKIKREGYPHCVMGLFHEAKLVGFARIQKWDDKVAMAGGVWKKDLGDNWGSLGPIGIAAGYRGKGLGHALLGAGLHHLKVEGVRRCLIDWTVMEKFYGAHGFKIARTYRSMNLDLESLPTGKATRRDVGLS